MHEDEVGKPISGLHNLQFSVHEISCNQNCFRFTFVHVGNRARKRGDVHASNNNTIESRCPK